MRLTQGACEHLTTKLHQTRSHASKAWFDRGFLACRCAQKHNLGWCVMGGRPVQVTNLMHPHVHTAVARVDAYKFASMEFGESIVP